MTTSTSETRRRGGSTGGLLLWCVTHHGIGGVGTGVTITASANERAARLQVFEYLRQKPEGYRQFQSADLLEVQPLEDSAFADEDVVFDHTTLPGVRKEIFLAPDDEIGLVVHMDRSNIGPFRARLFRINAQRYGLAYENEESVPEGHLYHRFEIAHGHILCRPEAQKVKELVELARRCAHSEGLGEHNALLSMYCHQDDLQNFRDREEDGRCLVWRYGPDCGASSVSLPGPSSFNWVSLGDWLKKSDCTPEVG